MKKWLVLLVCVVLLFSLVGCNQTDKDSTSSTDGSSVESQTSGEEVALTSFTEEGVTFSLPEGYQKMADDAPMYVADNYPDETDNLVIMVGPKDEEMNFDEITKEMYQEVLQIMLPDLVIDEFEKTTISDLPALKVKYSVTVEGVSMEGLQFLINGDKSYTLTYTLVNGKLKDSIDKCVESISIAK